MNEGIHPATPIARVVLASFIGTSIEWYDFFLYGTSAALVFNKLFFPTLDPFAGTMASLATYAVGFFARPLGGIVFGHYGDKIGRKSMLVTTLMMMGLSTFLIGVLPTVVLLGLGLFIRLHILETPLFAQAQAQRATSPRPLVDLVRNYPRNGSHHIRLRLPGRGDGPNGPVEPVSDQHIARTACRGAAGFRGWRDMET
jgi:hypothetical protein